MEENNRPDPSQEALDNANKRRQLEERRAAYYEERARQIEEALRCAKEAAQKATQAKQKMFLMMMRQKQKMDRAA